MKIENEKDINRIVNALAKFCAGKTDDFCSSENLRLTKTILDEKHVKIERENRIKTKKDKKKEKQNNNKQEHLKRKEQMERHRIEHNFRQHFLDRHI